MISSFLPHVFNVWNCKYSDSNKIGIRIISTTKNECDMINSYNRDGLNGLANHCIAMKKKCTLLEVSGVYLSGCNMINVKSNLNSEWLSKKTVRSISKLYSYLKTFEPSRNINPILLLENIVYDKPFIYFNDLPICTYIPSIDDTLNKKDLSFKDGIIHYRNEKPIYILEDGTRRHIPAILLDEFFINVQTGDITGSYCGIVNDCYICTTEVYKNGIWFEVNRTNCPITGFKDGR